MRRRRKGSASEEKKRRVEAKKGKPVRVGVRISRAVGRSGIEPTLSHVVVCLDRLFRKQTGAEEHVCAPSPSRLSERGWGDSHASNLRLKALPPEQTVPTSACASRSEGSRCRVRENECAKALRESCVEEEWRMRKVGESGDELLSKRGRRIGIGVGGSPFSPPTHCCLSCASSSSCTSPHPPFPPSSPPPLAPYPSPLWLLHPPTKVTSPQETALKPPSPTVPHTPPYSKSSLITAHTTVT